MLKYATDRVILRAMILSKKEIQTLLIIVFIGMSGLMGIDIHLPSMPALMHYFHTDRSHIQQSVSWYLFGLMVGVLFYGPLSDKYGRKPIVIFGMTFAALACIACVFAKTISMFLFWRLLQGLGAGVCSGLARTMSADVLRTPQKRNLSSYFSVVVSSSPVIAPVIGGYLQSHLDWQANFIFLAGFLLLMVVLYVLFCGETNTHIQRDKKVLRSAFYNYGFLLQQSSFVLSVFMTAMARVTTTAYATLSAFLFITELHLTPVQYGLVTMSASLGLIVAKIIKPSITKRIGEARTIALAFIMMAFSALLLALMLWMHMMSVMLIIISVFITLTAQPLVVSNTMFMALGPFHDKRGAAGALFASFVGLITFAVSLAIAAASGSALTLLAILYALFAVLGLIALRVYLRRAV